MPWFPDFVSAAELARKQTRAAGRADPVGQYLGALDRGDPHVLETAWPGDLVVYDPRAGTVRGHRALARFIHRNKSWLTDRHARVTTVASTLAEGRAAVELLVSLDDQADELAWPVAVVAESPDDASVVFRTYCSQLPVDGRRHVRAAILGPGTARPADVVERYQTALRAGDVAAIVTTFADDGYLRESAGPASNHQGTDELRSFFTAQFSAGGGIDVETCAVTDDGVRCALEYNCLRWGDRDLVPQAGLAVFERDAHGLLAAVRVYDDVTPPATSVTPAPRSSARTG